MRTRLVAASVAVVVVTLVGMVLQDTDNKTSVTLADVVVTSTSTSTTTSTTTPPPPATPPATAPPTSAATVRIATPPPTAPPTTGIVPAPTLRTRDDLVPGGAAVFTGFGAWIDVYDWSNAYTANKPTVGPSDIDRMASKGVQTLYVQAAKKNSPDDVIDRYLLDPILKRARANNMRIIAWYVPSLEDPALDLRKLLAMHALNVDGIGVDIESRAVSDPAERSRRLVDLSIALRQRLPGIPLAAIPMPAVQMEVVNTGYWPGFPYREIAPAYDVWMPMSYWTSRKESSGYRNAYVYTAENIDRLRTQLGQPNAPVHPIGGIGDVTSAADIDGFYQAAVERGSLGGSIYDYRTTHDALWPGLARFVR